MWMRVKSRSFFDGCHDDNIYFNSPHEYLPNTTDPWKYNHMGIVLGTGEWDNTRHESYRLSDILSSKVLNTGSTTENGADTTGITGETCCPIICQKSFEPRFHASSRARAMT